MADYVVKFIKGAKRVHGLDIDYTGIWNERAYDIAWIKRLRKTLDANGLGQVGIIIANQCENVWKIEEDINKDPELKAAVFAIGVHYPRCKSTPAAMHTGKRLWSSEDGPSSAGVERRRKRQPHAAPGDLQPQLHHRQDDQDRNLEPYHILSRQSAAAGLGADAGRCTWSGHYELPPALWVTAHTTQFAQPGWKYLDGACQLLPGAGSLVALQAPNGNDYSIIIETTEAKGPQTLTFRLFGGLSSGTVNVWRTNAREQFRGSSRDPSLEQLIHHHCRSAEPLFVDHDHWPTKGRGEISPGWGDSRSSTTKTSPARASSTNGLFR